MDVLPEAAAMVAAIFVGPFVLALACFVTLGILSFGVPVRLVGWTLAVLADFVVEGSIVFALTGATFICLFIGALATQGLTCRLPDMSTTLPFMFMA